MSKADTSKMDVDTPDEKVESKEKTKKTDEEPDLQQLFVDNVSLLSKGVLSEDLNLIRRVFTRTTPLRRFLTLWELHELILSLVPDTKVQDDLLQHIDPLLVSSEKPTTGGKFIITPFRSTVEVEAYFYLHIVYKLMQLSKFAEARKLCVNVIEKLNSFNRQTIDNFNAKFHQLISFCDIKSSNPENLKEILQAYRTACLRLYYNSQAVLINLVLGIHIRAQNFNQARIFDTGAKFPLESNSSNVSNAQTVRYMYYKAFILAVTAEYSKSDELSTRAIRKSTTGKGFLMALYKLSIVTKLLIGEIPEKHIFKTLDFTKEVSFKSYFALVKIVRDGSVTDFEALDKGVFEKDGLGNLVMRLRSAVIRRGLRRINLSYSRISFKDIEEKLGVKNVEMLCAKAIRDGILSNAVIFENDLVSQEKQDVYSRSMEPKEEFSKRAAFCSTVYTQAMKAHKYATETDEEKASVSV